MTDNMEYTPVHELVDYITPAPNVFQVDHFGVPDVSRANWSLSVGGLVDRPLELSVSDLTALPQREVTAVHECAGNPASPLIPQRRVANVMWTGVSLTTLIEAVGVSAQAKYVISQGADGGAWRGSEHPCYEKDLPLSKASDPSVMVVFEMNRKPIPIDRGGPLRLVVPGFYGTNSTKWLQTLCFCAQRSTSAFTTTYYTDREIVGNSTRETPVWTVAPNSIIVSPVNGRPVDASPLEIWGWCWGAHPIARLDVSTDGGHSWEHAELSSHEGDSWQRFALPWAPPSVGEYCLVARATDTLGDSQPDLPRRNQIYRSLIHVGGRG
ncbi:MAG: molybdopterin-dependent oxidoreductase [Jatrophihabitans sp.]